MLLSCNITCMLWAKKSTERKNSLHSTNSSLQNEVFGKPVYHKNFYQFDSKKLFRFFSFMKIIIRNFFLFDIQKLRKHKKLFDHLFLN